MYSQTEKQNRKGSEVHDNGGRRNTHTHTHTHTHWLPVEVATLTFSHKLSRSTLAVPPEVTIGQGLSEPREWSKCIRFQPSQKDKLILRGNILNLLQSTETVAGSQWYDVFILFMCCMALTSAHWHSLVLYTRFTRCEYIKHYVWSVLRVLFCYLQSQTTGFLYHSGHPQRYILLVFSGQQLWNSYELHCSQSSSDVTVFQINTLYAIFESDSTSSITCS